MQLHDKKWLATCALGALGLAGASAAQAQVRVSPYQYHRRRALDSG